MHHRHRRRASQGDVAVLKIRERYQLARGESSTLSYYRIATVGALVDGKPRCFHVPEGCIEHDVAGIEIIDHWAQSAEAYDLARIDRSERLYHLRDVRGVLEQARRSEPPRGRGRPRGRPRKQTIAIEPVPPCAGIYSQGSTLVAWTERPSGERRRIGACRRSAPRPLREAWRSTMWLRIWRAKVRDVCPFCRQGLFLTCDHPIWIGIMPIIAMLETIISSVT